jgi:asparagine synthase (glutamine-hydrolysing)
MCGLAGFVGEGDHADLRAMTLALAHRGPDGEGFFVDKLSRVYLGHRRLAIIDVGGGYQPLWNENDTVAVIYNGEIYNHVELRTELVARGHIFRSSHSDTEVLVHGYEEWGSGLPERLNGMFAFVIYDMRRQELFVARDRFGEKPFYYAWRSGLFAFASELAGLVGHRGVSTELDARALQKFFAYGYLPAPYALYRGCAKLPGGCHMRVRIDGSKPQITRYWKFTIDSDPRLLEQPEEALVEELRGLLFQAVHRRLISDVPLGVFLSGGIDSSTVVAAAAAHLPRGSIETFTIGFTEPSFDESAFAREVAETFGTHHRQDTLDANAARAVIPEVLGRLDEPLGDASIVPTFLLSRFTRRSVTVALSGDGGDELFAGYDPFAALAPARFYQNFVPSGLHRQIRRLADFMPLSTRNMAWDFKVRRSLAGLSYAQSMWNPVWLGPVEPDAIADLFHEPLAADELFSDAVDLWNRNPKHDVVDRTLEFFTNFYLQDDILAKVDRAAMMSSLESRAVFLDNDLVDFCRRLPHQLKYRRGDRKYLLKKAVAGLLPANILARRKKGFGIPLAKWLKIFPPVPPMMPIPGMDLDEVRRCWSEHRGGSADRRLFLWSWLSLQAVNSRASAAARGRVAA